MSMTTPARRRAEDFEALLTGRRPSTAAAAEELGPLVALARGLTPAEQPPSAEFRAALRDRLVAAASERVPAPAVPAPRRAPPTVSRFRRTVAAVALSAVVAGVGAAAASTRALPGDPLYGLKRQLENAQLELARGDVGHGRELLEQGDARLGEAEALAAGPGSTDPETRNRIAHALAEMAAAVDAGSADLLQAYRETGDPEPMRLLERFATEQRERLDDLAQLLDPVLAGRAQALADRLAALESRASAVLPADLAAGSRQTVTALDGWAVSRLADLAASGATGSGAAGPGAGGARAGGAGAGGGVGPSPARTATGALGSAVGGVVGGVGGVVGGVGGVTGGGTPTSGGVLGTVRSALPTLSPAPLPTSSPLLTDPVGTVTSALPLPTSSALPSISACVPLPPITTC